MDHNLDDIAEYIKVKPPYMMESGVYGTFFLAGFGLLGFIACIPYPWFMAFIVTSAAAIYFWGRSILKDLEKNQILYFRYIGVSCLVLSVNYFLLSIAGADNVYGLKPIDTVLRVGTGYVGIVMLLYFVTRNRLKSDYYSEANQEKVRKSEVKQARLAYALPALMLLFTFVMKEAFGQTYTKATIWSFTILSYSFLWFGAHYAHRYYMMQKYEPYVRLFTIDKKTNTVTWKTSG